MCCVVFPVFAKLDKGNVQLVSELESVFGNLDKKARQASLKADSLKGQIAQNPGSESLYKLNERLGDYYIEQDIDSAMFYWQVARQEAIVSDNPADALGVDFKRIILIVKLKF